MRNIGHIEGYINKIRGKTMGENIRVTKKIVDRLTYRIIGCAIEVLKEMGPGLLESVYGKCLIYELELNGYDVQSQQIVPLCYKGIQLESRLRYDILVNELIVVEMRAVDEVPQIAGLKLMNYMRLIEKPKGIIINFTCANLVKDGQKTYVNKFYAQLPDE